MLIEGLRRLGWTMEVPRAGMFVWAKIPEPWSSRMSTMDFAMMLLEQGNVAVSPGSGFGPAGEGYLRISLVENENRLRQAVRQIARCLELKARELGWTSPSAATTPASAVPSSAGSSASTTSSTSPSPAAP